MPKSKVAVPQNGDVALEHSLGLAGFASVSTKSELKTTTPVGVKLEKRSSKPPDPSGAAPGLSCSLANLADRGMMGVIVPPVPGKLAAK